MKGRPHRYIDPEAVAYWRSKGFAWSEVCAALGISYSTLRANGLLDGRTAASYRPGYMGRVDEPVSQIPRK